MKAQQTQSKNKPAYEKEATSVHVNEYPPPHVAGAVDDAVQQLELSKESKKEW